jgi:hypothetical protein
MITTKAVMDSLPEDAGGGPLAVLSRFRAGFHACLTARPDELSELADAVLCADGRSGAWPHDRAASLPVAGSEELSKLERACQGCTFAQRRDAAIIAVFRATGIRAAELAGIRYDAHDPQASDVDLWQREITRPGEGRQGAGCQDHP